MTCPGPGWAEFPEGSGSEFPEPAGAAADVVGADETPMPVLAPKARTISCRSSSVLSQRSFGSARQRGGSSREHPALPQPKKNWTCCPIFSPGQKASQLLGLERDLGPGFLKNNPNGRRDGEGAVAIGPQFRLTQVVTEPATASATPTRPRRRRTATRRQTTRRRAPIRPKIRRPVMQTSFNGHDEQVGTLGFNGQAPLIP